MKLYVVTADTYDSGYGAEISLFGAYTDLEEAAKRKRYVDVENFCDAIITEIDSCTDCEEYIGGYIE